MKMKKTTLDMLGKKFNKLTLIEFTDKTTADGHAIGRFTCDCGGEKYAQLSNVRGGTITSCGCLRLESARKAIKISHKLLLERGVWSKDPKMGSAKQRYHESYSDGNLSFEDFFKISQLNCYYCDAPPANSSNYYKYDYKNKIKSSTYRVENGTFIYNGLDRIDSSKIHDLDNVVPCCAHCNRAKMARTQPDFLDWIERVYNFRCKSNQPRLNVAT